MKKFLFILAASATALVMSCGSAPAAKTAAKAPAEPVTVFSLDGEANLTIAENKPYNYQGLFNVPGWVVEKGDSVTITIKGTTDVDVALLKCFLVSTGSGWDVLSGYADFSTSPLKVGEEFEFTHSMKATASGASGNNISFYIEFSDAKSAPTLTLNTLEVVVQ